MGMKCEYCDCLIYQKPENGTCPNCGAVLRVYGNWDGKSKQPAEWTEDMLCPKCGGRNHNGKKCAFCGTQLIEEKLWSKNTKKGATTIPTSGGYLSTGDSLVLSDSGVSICTISLFSKSRTQIPYSQLTTVIYSRPTIKPAAHGALLFRGEGNKNIPIPKKEKLCSDKSAITLSKETDTLFYHIFYMLKAVAPTSTYFEMIVSPSNTQGLDELGKSIDMDYFFDMYAPHRERAASAIHTKHEIPLETAWGLVNRDFDARQKKQYEADPLDAIRDLNLVVEDMRRKERLANQRDAERRKRLEREELVSRLEELKKY